MIAEEVKTYTHQLSVRENSPGPGHYRGNDIDFGKDTKVYIERLQYPGGSQMSNRRQSSQIRNQTSSYQKAQISMRQYNSAQKSIQGSQQRKMNRKPRYMSPTKSSAMKTQFEDFSSPSVDQLQNELQEILHANFSVKDQLKILRDLQAKTLNSMRNEKQLQRRSSGNFSNVQSMSNLQHRPTTAKPKKNAPQISVSGEYTLGNQAAGGPDYAKPTKSYASKSLFGNYPQYSSIRTEKGKSGKKKQQTNERMADTAQFEKINKNLEQYKESANANQGKVNFDVANPYI